MSSTVYTLQICSDGRGTRAQVSLWSLLHSLYRDSGETIDMNAPLRESSFQSLVARSPT